MPDSQTLLEQYKLYVEMADRVSARRADTNKFYISLLTALLIVISFTIEKSALVGYQGVIFVVVGIMGIALNLLWYINIRSYRQLNSGKFKVIQEMEEQLAFACYKEEWEILGKGQDAQRYLQLTRVERFVPLVLALPYVLLIFYALARFINDG